MKKSSDENNSSETARSAGLIGTWPIAILLILAAIFLVLEVKTKPPEGRDDLVDWIKLFTPQVFVYVFGVLLVTWCKFDMRRAVLIIVVSAAIFRIVLVPQFPSQLSSDIFRYVWDGRVQMAGINPYRYIPSDEHLSFLQSDPVYPGINRRDYAHTIYPPAAQMIFLSVCAIWPSVTGMKAAMVLLDLLTILLLIKLLRRLGMNPALVLIYASHPLIIWEFAQSGHLDAAVITLVVAAHWARLNNRNVWTGILLGLATITKFQPIILFPSLWRKWDWKMPVALTLTVIAGYIPYIKVGWKVFGFLPSYFSEEGFINGSRFYILNRAQQFLAFPSWAFLLLAAALMGSLALSFVLLKESSSVAFLKRSLAIVSSWTLIISPVHAWYGCWMIPFLCFTPWVGLIYYSCSLAYTHLFWLGEVWPWLPSRIWDWQYRITFLLLIIQAAYVTVKRSRKTGGTAKLLK